MFSVRLFNIFFLVGCSYLAAAPPAFSATPKNIKEASPLAGARVDSIPRGKVITNVSCQADVRYSYAVYIPRNSSKKLPLVIMFDPHGNGLVPVNMYREEADKSGYILVGSHNSKNGNDWQESQTIFLRLFADIRARLPVDLHRVAVAGFSGGAKVASFLALTQPGLSGIVAMGGALPDLPGDFPGRIILVSGRQDMNLTEMEAIDSRLERGKSLVNFMLFDGKHEWPPAIVFRSALRMLQLDAMRASILSKNIPMIRETVTEMDELIQRQTAKKDFLAVERTATLAADMLEGLSDRAGGFQEKAKATRSLDDYQLQLKQWNEMLKTEALQKEEFSSHFGPRQESYWKSRIAEIKQKAAVTSAAGEMNQRLIAYLSLAFCSISSQLLHGQQVEKAAFFIEQYKQVDPGNPEAWYFSAIVSASRGNRSLAEQDLLAAVSNGFEDSQRMRVEPVFQRLPVNFAKIEKAMNGKRHSSTK